MGGLKPALSLKGDVDSLEAVGVVVEVAGVGPLDSRYTVAIEALELVGVNWTRHDFGIARINGAAWRSAFCFPCR